MSEQLARHRVFVRHGEGEGDLRRELFRLGKPFTMTKTVEEEELTPRGEEQSRQSGMWVQDHVIARHGLLVQRGRERRDGFFVSPTYRTMQSAVAMNLSDAWQSDSDLDERNRGLIAGWRRERHEKEFPESYAQMLADPVHWLPPGGESIVGVADMGVAERADRFMSNVDDLEFVIVVGHRDWMWAAQKNIEDLTDEQLAMVDTDAIHNAQIIYYTNVNPDTGLVEPGSLWKRSVCPWKDVDETSIITMAA